MTNDAAKMKEEIKMREWNAGAICSGHIILNVIMHTYTHRNSMLLLI